ncbi:hypothetical protein ASF79_00855 [Agreia sp. Leaf335]|uniref:LacI family DNA-binding transcriptional regulator n=1 Tax=Agreia sp. Leaf335 TaxID=1736340 RepID=UPI0006F30051|nr:LacI family DNA-binding transcriptional regulator [Agreia sp. Leaf335]KQR23844.1 hypothetical protein ASF79_00855 [Agreia sp. Leaf335]
MTAMTPARRATSSDVAKRVGLSRTTVSQILNGNVSSFPQETRDRVAVAAAELNYRPSRAGRALVTGVSDMVVITIPSATFGPHLQNAVDQITEASAALGMSVVVHFARRDTASTLTSVLDLRPLAIVDFGVFTPAQGRTLEASGSHVLPSLPEAERGIEDELDTYVGRLQVRELVRRGKRRVIFAQLDDTRTAPYGDVRLRGVQAECAALNLPEPVVVRVQLEAATAEAEMRSALELTGEEPVAVCAYNDDVAIAIIAATRRLNLAVPSRVGVIGVDHTVLGQLVTPRLTTVHIDLPRIIDGYLHQLASIRGTGGAPPEETTPFVLSEVVWTVSGDSC